MFLLDKNYYYYVWFFTCTHIQIFFFKQYDNDKKNNYSLQPLFFSLDIKIYMYLHKRLIKYFLNTRNISIPN